MSVTNEQIAQWIKQIRNGDSDEALRGMQHVLDTCDTDFDPTLRLTQDQLCQAYAKGYRYYTRPTDDTFPPLCVKSSLNLSRLMQWTYPDNTFHTATINPDGTLTQHKKVCRAESVHEEQPGA